jgi:hypothetical protein
VKGTVYYDIPLLNYVGWFVLMFLAPLGWILIARQRERVIRVLLLSTSSKNSYPRAHAKIWRNVDVCHSYVSIATQAIWLESQQANSVLKLIHYYCKPSVPVALKSGLWRS